MTKRSVDRAVEQFRAGERDLYTDEGQRLYSDEEHERRLEALLETFDRRGNLRQQPLPNKPSVSAKRGGDLRRKRRSEARG
jgi:hypothetical protein